MSKILHSYKNVQNITLLQKSPEFYLPIKIYSPTKISEILHCFYFYLENLQRTVTQKIPLGIMEAELWAPLEIPRTSRLYGSERFKDRPQLCREVRVCRATDLKLPSLPLTKKKIPSEKRQQIFFLWKQISPKQTAILKSQPSKILGKPSFTLVNVLLPADILTRIARTLLVETIEELF